MVLENNKIPVKGVHIEVTNMCTLQCPKCPRTIFKQTFPNKWKNYNLNLKDFINFLDIDIKDISFNLEGNYGDAIYYNNIFELCKWIKINGGNIKLVTNGSYKTKNWWVELSQILNEKDFIIWSIDGTPENFTTYRINGDWNSIKDGIEIIAKTNIQTQWKYIIFDYNQNDINFTKDLSEQLGISNFKIYKSDRYLLKDNSFIPDQQFLSEKFNSKVNWIKNKNENLIDPECLKFFSSHFISADGYYSPCCYIADHRFYYKTIWGKNKKNFAIKNTTLSQILQREEVINYYSNLSKNVCDDVCRFNCPKL